MAPDIGLADGVILALCCVALVWYTLGSGSSLGTDTGTGARPSSSTAGPGSAAGSAVWLPLGVAPSAGRPGGVVVVALSDTHGKHSDVTVPDGDILLFAGDFTRDGNGGVSATTASFNAWLGALPHPHKFVVGGNHEKLSSLRGALTNAVYLEDEARTVTVRGSRVSSSTQWRRCQLRTDLAGLVPAAVCKAGLGLASGLQ